MKMQAEIIPVEPSIRMEQSELTFDSGQLFAEEVAPIQLGTQHLLNPVTVQGTKVKFDMESMVVGNWYPFIYKGHEHLVVKRSQTVVDIYRVSK